MKLKATLTLSLFASVFMMAKNSSSGISFTYAYRISANSYRSKDEIKLYSYKEKLIDLYEELCFGYETNYYEDIIKLNINKFKFDSEVKAYYRNGMIALVIGSGGGYTIRGDLRKNECDDSVIREKFYFFDIFS